jgi:FKBP-type peptidyl-prolyl cis-trans isomerase FkpA
MTKNFIAAVIIGVLVLIIFSYFIFGLNGSAPAGNTSDTSNPANPITITQVTSAPTTAASANEELQIQDETIGTGKTVKKGDTVDIKYVGTLTNGTKFDASADHGNGIFTTQIGVGQVIKGWDEGIIGMKVGGKRKLTIPPSLGYGNQAVGSIPANSTLIFQVELVGIK